MDPAVRCNVCSSEDVREAGPIGRMPVSVTSDSSVAPLAARIQICGRCGHVQKRFGEQERALIDQNYARYIPHHLSDGREQLVFPDGCGPRTRSEHVFEQCRPLFKPRGRLLDFGTGNGVVLRTASRQLPAWDLFGHDIGDWCRDEIEAIPGVRKFWVGAAADIPERFDVIVLWHVLEHIPEPLPVLQALGDRLAPDGLMLVQVPALERNPFDMAVVDHASHFTARTLAGLVARAGLAIAHDGADWIHNCHTLVLERGTPREGTSFDDTGETTVRWLARAVNCTAARLADQEYAIFGIGVAGLWIMTQLPRRPTAFVDEDRARVGKQMEGIPIVAPAEVPAGMPVLMAFVPSTGGRIADRLRRTCPAWADRPVLLFDEA